MVHNEQPDPAKRSADYPFRLGFLWNGNSGAIMIAFEFPDVVANDKTTGEEREKYNLRGLAINWGTTYQTVQIKVAGHDLFVQDPDKVNKILQILVVLGPIRN